MRSCTDSCSTDLERRLARYVSEHRCAKLEETKLEETRERGRGDGSISNIVELRTRSSTSSSPRDDSCKRSDTISSVRWRATSRQSILVARRPSDMEAEMGLDGVSLRMRYRLIRNTQVKVFSVLDGFVLGLMSIIPVLIITTNQLQFYLPTLILGTIINAWGTFTYFKKKDGYPKGMD